MNIAFQPVTAQNFRALVQLHVSPAQETFIAPNLYAIAEAYVEPGWTPLAIVAGDELIGFAQFGLESDTGRWWLMRIMIGAEQQGRGYGTAALRALIELMVERHGCREIFLNYAPGNDVAGRLYARGGFVPTGEIKEGQIVARLDLPGAST